MHAWITILLLIPLIHGGVHGAAGDDSDSAPSFVESVIEIPRWSSALALRDLDGDGRAELISVDALGFGVRRLDAEGRYPERIGARLAWPGESLAWDLVDLDDDGAVEILAFVDGREVRRWSWDPQRGFDAGSQVLEARGYLPRRIVRASFARDVDGDGKRDLVLPGAGHYRIHLARESGYAEPLEVEFEADVRHRVGDPDRLDGHFGQTVSVPWFTVEDVDGDGRQDLISRMDDRVRFHLAGEALPAEPTWVLDLAGLKDELPDARFDTDNLLSYVSRGTTWKLAELDGRPPRDLVLQVGGTIRTYFGGARSGPSDTPDQVLKSSGNVLAIFLRDVQGDARPDLQIVRGERLSLARALRWLILPGDLEFDFYTYRNEDGAFSRKPTRRHSVALRIPRLLSLMKNIDEKGEELDRQWSIPARQADLTGDGSADDIVDLVDNQVVVYLGAGRGVSVIELPEFSDDVQALLEYFLLEELDQLEDGGTKTLDLDEVERWEISPGARLRNAYEGREPDARHPVSGTPDEDDGALRVVDLNGDGLSDLIVVCKPASGKRRIQFLLSRL